MVFGRERRKRARPKQVGNVSREAQRRVDKRVIEIIGRRDAAARRDSRSDQALPGASTSRPAS